MDIDNIENEENQKELTDAERDPSYFNYYAQLTHQVNTINNNNIIHNIFSIKNIKIRNYKFY